MTQAQKNQKRNLAGAWSCLTFLVLLVFLAALPGARAAHAGGGLYKDGVDKVEIASDSGFNNLTASFNRGDTVYVRITTPRIQKIDAGALTLRGFTDAGMATGAWKRERGVFPYVYTAALTVPDSSPKYLQVRGLMRDGPYRFLFSQALQISGADRSIRTFRDAGRTVESNSFRPGATVYLRTYGTGEAYFPAQAGVESQVLRTFGNEAVAAWDPRDFTVSQKGNIYDYALTLPEGPTDDWWYNLRVRLNDVSGEVIVDQGTMLKIDETAPETFITAPVGGQELGGADQLITGAAVDNAAIRGVKVAMVRDEDGYYWDGAMALWVAVPVWHDAAVTSGQGTPSASWQYSWTLPDKRGDYTILAKAVDETGLEDPTPAAANTSFDNIAPEVRSFQVAAGASFTATTTVTLESDVRGVEKMRFAETKAALSTAPYAPYSDTVAFALESGDGARSVYAQYRDRNGNETDIGAPEVADDIVLDTIAPAVGTVAPTDGSKNVPVDTPIEATFDEADQIDVRTIRNDGTKSGSTFYLTGESGRVPATIDYDRATKTASLIPSESLDPAAEYAAHLTTGVRDRAGNALDAPAAWSFVTEGLTHAPPGPAGVSATAGDLKNLVSWAPVDPGGDIGGDFGPPGRGGYNVYRRAATEGPWKKANSSLITKTRFEETVRGAKSVYFYRISAVDEAGTESPPSAVADTGKIDMSKSTNKSKTVRLAGANGDITLKVPPQRAAKTITVTTPSDYPPGVKPVTYVYEFKPSGTVLEPAATVTFRTPKDPTGMKVAVNRGAGWKTLEDGDYRYDVSAGTISYTGIDQFSHYTVVESSATAPHGTYLSTTAFCAVCHNLHGEKTSGLQRDQRLLRAEEDNPAASYTGTWVTRTGGERSSGGGLVSSTAGDKAHVVFRGAEISWLATKTPGSGRARVYIDGIAREDIELYNTTDTYQAPVFRKTGLANDDHTMTVEVLGTKSASSTGFAVEIDAYDIKKPKDMGLVVGDEKAVCYICHDGTGSAYDIATQFGETSGTPEPVSKHPIDTGVVLCSDCHSPHAGGENWDGDHTAGEVVRLLRGDFGTYLGYVVDESNGWLDTPKPANLVYGLPEERKVSRPYEACGSCHGAGSTLPGGNILANYGDSGGLQHDSTDTIPTGAKAGIACTSCHEWHVSDLPKLLESTVSGNAVTGNDNSVCYACHEEAKITAYSDPDPTGDIHGAAESTKTAVAPGLLSPYNYRYPQIRCSTCHDPHGTGNALWIPETVNGKSPITVDSTGGADWAQVEDFCTACHTGTHNPGTVCVSCHYHGANTDVDPDTKF